MRRARGRHLTSYSRVVSEAFSVCLELRIVAEKVHRTVAVAEEIVVLPCHLGNRSMPRVFAILRRNLFQVKDVYGQAPAAAVALPGAEFLGSSRYAILVPAGEKAGQASREVPAKAAGPLAGNMKILVVAARPPPPPQAGGS